MIPKKQLPAHLTRYLTTCLHTQLLEGMHCQIRGCQSARDSESVAKILYPSLSLLPHQFNSDVVVPWHLTVHRKAS